MVPIAGLQGVFDQDKKDVAKLSLDGLGGVFQRAEEQFRLHREAARKKLEEENKALKKAKNNLRFFIGTAVATAAVVFPGVLFAGVIVLSVVVVASPNHCSCRSGGIHAVAFFPRTCCQ